MIFLPFIVVALLSLFPYVSSLPMDSSVSKDPPGTSSQPVVEIKTGHIVEGTFTDRARTTFRAAFAIAIETMPDKLILLPFSTTSSREHTHFVNLGLKKLYEELYKLNVKYRGVRRYISLPKAPKLYIQKRAVVDVKDEKTQAKRLSSPEATRAVLEYVKKMLTEGEETVTRAKVPKVVYMKIVEGTSDKTEAFREELLKYIAAYLSTSESGVAPSGSQVQTIDTYHASTSGSRVASSGSQEQTPHDLAIHPNPNRQGVRQRPYDRPTGPRNTGPSTSEGRARPGPRPSQVSYSPPPYPPYHMATATGNEVSYSPPPYPPYHAATATGNEVFHPGQEGLPFHEVDQTGVPFASGSVPHPDLSFHHNLPEDLAFARYLASLPPS